MNLVQNYKERHKQTVWLLREWIQLGGNRIYNSYIDLEDINEQTEIKLAHEPVKESVILTSSYRTFLTGWTYDYDRNKFIFSPDFVEVNNSPVGLTVRYNPL